MSDWDDNSPQLALNLSLLLRAAAASAQARETPSLDLARTWHRQLLHELTVPDPRWVGSFRGQRGVRGIEVRLLSRLGLPSSRVGSELKRFEAKLLRGVAALDADLPAGAFPTRTQVAALLDLSGWTHAEWIRIHPFANGNGRTARLWVNWLAMRYSLPPFLRLRPRPGRDYLEAARHALEGEWRPTALMLQHVLREFADAAGPVP